MCLAFALAARLQPEYPLVHAVAAMPHATFTRNVWRDRPNV